jgi:hypothetical protein
MFTEMIYQGDRVSSCKSHQATLHTVLSELANLHALRVKNLRDDHEKLPSKCNGDRDAMNATVALTPQRFACP